MDFSVIYSVDIPRDEEIGEYLPTRPIRRKMQQTEGDEEYEYGHLEGCWEKGKHRKLCGILNRQQFERFLEETGIFPEDVETMGSLGAPGFGYGVAPAISFRGDAYSAIQSAYVTPIPSFEPKNRGRDEDWQERSWARIKRAVLKVFG